jgi:hypothetical protein
MYLEVGGSVIGAMILSRRMRMAPPEIGPAVMEI